MRVAWYDSYTSIPCMWDPSHILWKLRSPTYVSAVWCPILYRHDTSCRPSDVLYHIIMTFRVVRLMSYDILCRVVYVKAKGFMPTSHRKTFWYFIYDSSLVVCRRPVLLFEPCDGASLFCPGSVCAPANGWSNIQSEQTSSEWRSKKLTYKACGDQPQCFLWWDPEVSSGVLRIHIGYRGPARQGSVISSPWDPILWSERRP